MDLSKYILETFVTLKNYDLLLIYYPDSYLINLDSSKK